MNTAKYFKKNASPDIKSFCRLPLMALCVLMLSACASSGVVTEQAVKGDDDIVVERAKARWEALLGKDLETAYSYYSPGYRSATSAVDYMFQIKTRRVKWESAEYLEHSCTDRSCKVKFKTGFKVEKAVPGMDVYHGFDDVEETWVKPDDEWWYVPPKG